VPDLELLLANEPRLKSYVRRRIFNRDDVEDVLQEIFARILTQSRRVRVLDPVAYAFRIADNLIRDLSRRQRAPHQSLTEDLPCHEAHPAELLETHERASALDAALAAMPPLRREVFLRRRVDGESYEAIAAALDLSVGAVQKHYSRAAVALRKTLVGAE
jgi:RNA polymerase sigma-70 factor (ECF subfamily)